MVNDCCENIVFENIFHFNEKNKSNHPKHVKSSCSQQVIKILLLIRHLLPTGRFIDDNIVKGSKQFVCVCVWGGGVVMDSWFVSV